MIVSDWIKPVTELFDKIYTTDVTVWYLRRTDPPEPLGQLPFEVQADTQPSAAQYRQLYDGVGSEWLWWERRALTQSQLEAQFVEQDRLLLTPTCDGAAIGMVELSWPNAEVAEICMLGLLPHAVGKGYGKALMRLALNKAWRAGVREVQLNTCSLDHPRALTFYKSCGFAVQHSQSGKVQIPHRHIDVAPLNRIRASGSHLPS